MKKNMLIKLLISAIIICSISTIAFAGSGFIPDHVDPGLDIKGSENIKNMTTGIIGTMIWIGYALAIGMVIFIGIKYVISSADERASMKGMLVKVVVGSCILFMATAIVNVAISIFRKS